MLRVVYETKSFRGSSFLLVREGLDVLEGSTLRMVRVF